ncbi:efflux RND transporter periplasmic adaptor subunit [Photobacterium alginatilyticum]|uniref:Efflux RND transporter periplasmic adaptor subunit n=1 Tax=Photobacterium alginatilyticum TaxID=1775171 RepID=A0ABW9YQB3_9GAMM|nr:efflux RND transporter periplasmic adaptor subunit [Photobacterium alginatilyticum]NBI55691.1 efflux RND transporter periplasmic adaptor subunit [Photobacterium alginatilyticum]
MKHNLVAMGLIGALLSTSSFAVELIGHTRSKNMTNVVSEVSGTVEVSELETGALVSVGSVLANIKAQDFELEISKQEANLALVEADLTIKQSLYNRYRELRNKNSLSQNELDIAAADLGAAKATVALAQIELQKARLDLGYTRISADMNGYIVNRSVEDGAWVNQGDLLYQVVNIDVLNVRLLASEYDIGKLRVGQQIEIWAEANPELKVRSSIKRIGVELDPATFAYPVEVEINNPDHLFKPGMSIHASTTSADNLTASNTQP